MVEKEIYNLWIKRAPCRAMFLGIVLFLIGILRYLGYDWNMVLMAVGVLLFLKGILLKFKK